MTECERFLPDPGRIGATEWSEFGTRNTKKPIPESPILDTTKSVTGANALIYDFHFINNTLLRWKTW